MTDTSTIAASPIEKPDTRAGKASFFLWIAGPIVAYFSMLAANGNGWSPLEFLGLGLVISSITELCLVGRIKHYWRVRLLMLTLAGGTAFLLAMYSTRTNVNAVFQTVLGRLPDGSVSDIRGWTQWYDGRDTVVAFNATAEFIKRGIGSSRLNVEEIAPQRLPDPNADPMPKPRNLMSGLAFFDTDRLRMKPMFSPLVYVEANGMPMLIWDEKSRQGILYWGVH